MSVSELVASNDTVDGLDKRTVVARFRLAQQVDCHKVLLVFLACLIREAWRSAKGALSKLIGVFLARTAARGFASMRCGALPIHNSCIISAPQGVLHKPLSREDINFTVFFGFVKA